MVGNGPTVDQETHTEGLLRRVFLRQSLIGYTGIVPKYVKKGGFLPGRSQTQATDSLEKLLFTPCATVTDFTDASHSESAKSTTAHWIVRNFQFRKFLPVYSNPENA